MFFQGHILGSRHVLVTVEYVAEETVITIKSGQISGLFWVAVCYIIFPLISTILGE